MKLLEVDEFVKDAILTGKSAATLRDYMKETGYYNLLEDGLLKVQEGLTTTEEILRVATID